MTMPKVSSETWRWLLACFVSIIIGTVSATWAVANAKSTADRAIERLADTVAQQRTEVLDKLAAQDRTTAAVQAGILKELDSQVARQQLRDENTNRRLTEVEAQAKTNQAVLSTLEALKTEVRYLSQSVSELKQELKESRRGSN
jgi:hypothetical protein